MSSVFSKALVRVEREGVYGGLLGDEIALADGQLRVTHKGKLVESLPLAGVRVLHPPGTARPIRVAVGSDAQLAVSACDAAADLLFVLQHYGAGTSGSTNEPLAFFGRVHCSDAALRLRRASTQLPPAVYGPFPKLAHALELLQQAPAAQWRVWSRESSRGNGSRDYLVGTVEEFWKHLLLDPVGLYEVIRDEAQTRLFLDVEYSYACNGPPCAGHERVCALLQLLTAFLDMNFPMAAPGAFECVALESEYAQKFSEHIIFPRAVFRDVHHCGRFVDAFHSHARLLLTAADESLRDAASLCFVAGGGGDGGERRFVCDMGVYNRNRNFRLVYSSKRGKDAPLWPVGGAREMDFAVFAASLVTPIEAVRDPMEFGSSAAAAAAGRGAVSESARRVPDATRGRGTSGSKATDELVQSIIAGAGGYVRCVTAFGDRVLYSIAGGYRYCANVGRHHKSNNVYFLADLRVNKLYQRCYDPDCARFESVGVDIPGRFIEAAIARGELLPDAAFADME